MSSHKIFSLAYNSLKKSFFLFLLISAFCTVLVSNEETKFGDVNDFQFHNENYIHCLQKAKDEAFNKDYALSTKLFTDSKEGDRRIVKFPRNQTLRIVTIQRLPFTIVNRLKNGTKKFSGVIFELLEAISDKYQIRMKIFTTPDGNWGGKTKNGSWNGMVGIVLRREADVGAATFSITLERAQVIDFTQPFHKEPSAILIPAPKSEGQTLTVLIEPFSTEVWILLGLSIFVIVPTFYLLNILHHYVRNETKKQGNAQKSGLIINLFLFIVGSLVQESIVSPVEKTVRFLLGIWWMISLVLAHSYVAFLVALLSVPKLQNSIDSLEDLAKQSSIKWTFRLGTIHYNIFKSNTSDGVFKAIGEGVEQKDLVSTDSQGVNKVLHENYAFIKEKSFLEVALDRDFVQQKKCRMTLAKKNFFNVGLGLICGKNSPVQEMLNYEILNVVSTGILKKWKNIHWPKHIFCVNAAHYIITTSKGAKKLAFADIQGSLFLLAAGTSLALLVALIEITSYLL